MTFDMKDIKFPTYNGLESQYEHVIYNYLDEILTKYGYTVKIKKTEYENVDKALTTSGTKSCDAYIFNNKDAKDMGHNLFALFELESNYPNSKLKDGIKQVKEYCAILSAKYEQKIYQTENENIYSIVFDGENLCMWNYNIKTKNIINIMGDPDNNSGVKMSNVDNRYKFLDQFPIIESKKDEASETKTINDIKNHIRAKSDLQKNKSFLMTLLSSIYGKTKTDQFEDALVKLKEDTLSNESKGIIKEWEEFVPIIKYEKSPEIKSIIKEKLYNDAKSLWLLSQNKNMDLYGFIYEELAEEKSKQEEGEYYTSRHIIAPIISSVLRKYLFKIWGIDNNIVPKELVKILCSKRILDPFCGSGGFLYEFLRFFKNYYQVDDANLNKISKHALYGFDKNDTMAAFLNMYLIGDGETNLCQVTSSINWQNMWNYKVNDGEIKLIENETEQEKNITKNKPTIKYFINSLIDWEDIKKKFAIELSDFNYEILEKEICKKKSLHEFMYGLKKYNKEKDCILKYFYDLFIELSSNSKLCPNFEEFKKTLGCVDWIVTNIPYGKVDDIRLSTKEKGTLEALSLKECIDLLKPSTERVCNASGEEDQNGTIYKSNNDGGIATIIVPNGIFESENNKDIRDYLFEHCNILSIVKLPIKAFAPYASVQTFIVTVQKKAIFEFNNSMQKCNTFFYIVDNDGKANSDNRYPTTLIDSMPIEIGNKKLMINEYLHDDLAINIEQYPEGYMSKLERAWIHGNKFVDSRVWNQKRYNEVWDGSKWHDITETGIKWTFKSLEEKLYEKRIEKTNKDTQKVIEKILLNNNVFAQLNIEEQKEQIIKYAKISIIDDIESIICENKNNKLFVDIKSRTGKNKKLIKNIIFNNYEKLKIYNNKYIDIETLGNIVINTNINIFPKTIINIGNFVNEIDEIEIIDDNVSFYSKETYKQYCLVPENYLEPKEDFMSNDEIFLNIRRLRTMLRG